MCNTGVYHTDVLHGDKCMCNTGVYLQMYYMGRSACVIQVYTIQMYYMERSACVLLLSIICITDLCVNTYMYYKCGTTGHVFNTCDGVLNARKQKGGKVKEIKRRQKKKHVNNLV